MHGIKNQGIFGLFTAFFLAVTIAFSLNQIYEIPKEFTVTESLFSLDGVDFKPVDLPFFVDQGRYVIHFKTIKKNLDLMLYAKDCVEQVYLDGNQVYAGGCAACMHCNGLYMNLPVKRVATGVHTLDVKTGVFSPYTKHPFFFVISGKNEFLWRLTAFLSSIALLTTLYLVFSKKGLLSPLRLLFGCVRKRQTLVLLLMASLIVQSVLLPKTPSVDVAGWIVWVENLVHKKDLDFNRLDTEYLFTADAERVYMSKPPGAYLYPLAAMRLLFGFSRIYMVFLVKLPAVLGHLLVGCALWGILEEKTRDRKITVLGTALYLFNPGAIILAASLGKSDSLAIALLLFALKNTGGKKFPVYFGLAVLCKHTSLFLLPWLLIRKGMFRQVVDAGVIVVLLCLPFLAYNPHLFLGHLVGTHLNKPPQFLSWMAVFYDSGVGAEGFFTSFIWLYLLLLVVIAYKVDADAYSMGAIVFGLFIVFSKVVYEQYLLWVLPFLLLAYLLKDKTSALLGFLVCSFTLATVYEGHYLLSGGPFYLWTVMLALTLLLSSLDLIVSSARTGGYGRD